MSEVHHSTEVHAAKLNVSADNFFKTLRQVLPSGASQDTAIIRAQEALWHAETALEGANGNLPALSKRGRKPAAK